MISRFIIAAKIGFAEIFNNKMRSFLSIFAISIGVLTFLFVFSAINFSKEKMQRALDLGGENTIIFEDLRSHDNLHIKYSDIKDLQQKFPEVKTFIPLPRSARMTTVFNSKDYNTLYNGITPDWAKRNWVFGRVKGRFINWDDVQNRRRVAVFMRDPLSNKNKNRYRYNWDGYGRWQEDEDSWFKWQFYNKSMLGQKIKVLSETYTVVGEIQVPFYKNDERIEGTTTDFLIPITSFEDSAFYSKDLDTLIADVKDKKDVARVKSGIINYLRKKEGKRKSDYEVKTFLEKAENKLEEMKKTIMMISLLGLIAMISGGIGIMNVVLATIYARTKEIGTRRALGAGKGDIFMQFSFESVILSMMGACAGFVMSLYALDYMGKILSMQTRLDVKSVLLAFSIAALTGFLFSLYPSLKAANMNPVDALKVE